MTKKAMLVVSFGTSYHETRKKNIDAIESEMKNRFPDYRHHRAFTSGMIMKKLKNRDELHIHNVREALEFLKEEGVEEVVVVPTHIINGYEFEKVIWACQENSRSFHKLTISRPLLSTTDDFREVVEILDEVYDFHDGKAVIFMGHGSEHHANTAYPAMNFMLQDTGRGNAYIATVEGYPSFDMAVNFLEKKALEEVKLVPLMLVAGDHIEEDMLGDDEKSWKSILLNKGYHVEGILAGLGELPKIRQIYCRHVEEAIAGKGLTMKGGKTHGVY
ncbi:sirohydrochlorin cobaltochelatase [Alkalibacter rhizosphaerae]|uniref:Sirohydrochlorin cobaltochelatase n=1 Tax=Alkalibacter rhizosphaerae TaxID=2815577 RepID=A0A974XHL5_9FIRM|nr:sirohydrochlorin cobaltochelatase [Alkalibacter rhizosphaerae]QSX08825.1 sirohydrochlorin cobaltochelatase [Alkalibacter rhizosphaerae]